MAQENKQKTENLGNFKNNPERAAEAGRKGGQSSGEKSQNTGGRSGSSDSDR